MKCRYCGKEWQLATVPFSAVCEGCGRWLHSCAQCRLWDGDARMCRSMTTDPVADREGKNFCEEWKPGVAEPEPEQHGADRFNALFGD